MDTAQVIGRLLAGGFLSEVRETFGGIEMNAFQFLNLASEKLEEILGKEGAKTFIESSEQSMKALVYACVDKAVIEIVSDYTLDMISELTIEDKLLADSLYLHLTGQASSREGKMHPLLLKLREFVKKYRLAAPSKLPIDRIAEVVRKIVWEAALVIRAKVVSNIK
jgi:hypothetical protein